MRPVSAARAALRAARGFLPSLAAVTVAVVVATGSAAAHGEQILQLGTDRIQPGGAVEVRGDLGAGEAFEVALIAKADGSRRLLATIPAIEEGHFQSHVTIPADIPTGDYLVEVAVDLSVIRAPLTIAGSPITGNGEEGAGPDHDPMTQPTTVGVGAGAGVASSPLPDAAAPVAGRATPLPFYGAVVFGLAGIAAIGLLVALRLIGRARVARRKGQPGR